ncbi:3-oxoacyl-ACP synthase [Streptomyces sp. ERV7]|uniref:ketoacyl-ACP synthase III family protein n=1 Tax=Streptomyces sp. ERV7 TaxID=1322334 RepID=UPI0007F33F71|nr:ketoacyl-ACP synthase III family protein [Streptomyces sp. ERV7]OAR21947.1 3-oxoacyl-ACP synthase [Streptomyces sp. ERV7]
MRWQGIYVESAAVVTGEPETAAAAVAAGRYDAEEAARSRQRSVSVSDGLSGPELAVAAGRAALRRGGRPARDIGLLIHAACWYPGLEFWNVAAYVQHEVLGHGRALAFELRQMSNGGMSALETAASRLVAAPGAGAALLTTGDRFAEPAFPRWTTDRGLVFGDAGTAVVVSGEPAGFRLVATAAYSEPVLEGLHRGDEPFLLSGMDAEPLDLVARKKGFLRRMPVAEVTVRNESGMLTAVKECLDEAECDLSSMAAVIVPFFGAELSRRQCLGPLGIPAGRTLHDWGLEIGHLGAGDQFAGLARLLEQDELRPGDRVLAVGVGAGFSWTCAVLERV